MKSTADVVGGAPTLRRMASFRLTDFTRTFNRFKNTRFNIRDLRLNYIKLKYTIQNEERKKKRNAHN